MKSLQDLQDKIEYAIEDALQKEWNILTAWAAAFPTTDWIM